MSEIVQIDKKTEELANKIPEKPWKPSKKLDDWATSEGLLLIRRWVRWGDSHEDVAARIGISPTTLWKWRQENQYLDNAIRAEQEMVDSIIEDRMFTKARDGDMRAMQFWLSHRDPERWGGHGKNDEATIESIRLDNEIKRLKLEEMQRKSDNEGIGVYRGIPADVIAPAFFKAHHDIIRDDHHLEYILPGGRGSTKSSFISLEIINLLETNPLFHAVICRKVGDTMRTSVYSQMQWAIDKLGLSDEYKCTTAPLEIVKKSTEQHIYFRGADDPGKIKSIAVPFGHIGVLWFEELDQFEGAESVRKIEQSVIRGGDNKYIFKSFNPPRSKNNWANADTKTKESKGKNTMVVHSNYLDVPKEWLGKAFLDQAQFLKETSPAAYANEYMGEINGHGGNVFENVVPREITDEEIAGFDRVVQGLDWGFSVDPNAFIRIHYDRKKNRIFLFDEWERGGLSNKQIGEKLWEHGITGDDLLTCDNAEPKSISDLNELGFKATAARKGNGSREYTFKWLITLSEIVIDPVRCPNALHEFLNYEYERDKEGEFISGYPDKGQPDHLIDATRYAIEEFSRAQGTIKI